MARYWVFDWFDEAGVKTAADAKKALAPESGAAKRMADLAEEAQSVLWSPGSGKNGIVAGTGLDLTGNLACHQIDCLKADVDKLFRRVWHYFDTIIVADGITPAISHEAQHQHGDDRLREYLLSQLELLLHIREIGAEDLVEFRAKHTPSPTHLKEDIGLTAAAGLREMAKEVERTLAKHGTIRRDKEAWILDHPMLAHSQWVEDSEISGKAESEDRVRAQVARQVVQRFSNYLLTDIELAQRSGAPLGATNAVHSAIMRAKKVGVPDVVFRLELPFLEGVPISELLKVRADEAEAFQRFRDALRLAIKERLRLEPTVEAEGIADEIRDDLIEPELRRIRTRLTSAKTALAKQVGVSAVVGGLLTTCGLLIGWSADSLVQAVAPAISAGVGAAAKGAEGRVQWKIASDRDVEMSDMFFLWKALSHADDKDAL